MKPARSAVLAAFLFAPVVAVAEEELAIHVIVARTISPDPAQRACDTDLGYTMAVGHKDAVWGLAREKVRKEFPKARHLSNKDNYGKKDRYLGRYMVVLKAEEKKEGCTVTMYGIGFGTDEASAKADAEEYFWKHWHTRDPKKAPARVERSEKL